MINIGAKVIIPIGIAGKQKLHVYTKFENDKFSSQELDAVSFVPMLNGVSAGD